MITLAIDTATDRCGVAVARGAEVVERYLPGARRHTAEVLGLVGDGLRELGAEPRDITTVVIADGPGSFTGLRVSASVAKALAWRRPDVAFHVTPSLLVRAVQVGRSAGGTVLALSDALRGELYAGMWRFEGPAIVEVVAPRTLRPEELPTDPAAVVGTIPVALIDAVRMRTGCEPIVGEAALPNAGLLAHLPSVEGGTTVVTDPAHWEPTYGRPAEAQAVWERNHGQPLPAPSDRLG